MAVSFRSLPLTLPWLFLHLPVSLLWMSLIRTLVIEFRVHLGDPGPHLKFLKLIISARILLPNKVTFIDSGRWDMVISS